MNQNRAPEIQAIPNQTVHRGDVLDIPVQVTDADADPITLRAENGSPGFPLPDFVTFTDNGDGTGVFHVAPGVGARGDHSLVLVANDDGDGDGRWARLETSYTFILTVISENDPPVLSRIGDKVAVTGEPFLLPLQASDNDQEPLHFSVSGLPATATIIPGSSYGTATLSWVPGTLDRGTYTATFTVTDEGNGLGSPASDSETITLVVRDTNATPVVPNVLDKILQENQNLTFSLNATDPDGDPLTYSAENLPEGARFDPLTGVFDWTPTFSQAGDYTNIKLIASDGHRSRFVTFTIFVENTNRAPQIVPLAPQYALEGNTMQFTVTAGDADGGALIYSASDLPAGATFNPTTATFTWTPGYEQAGTYTVTFSAQDPGGLSDSTQVELRVDNVNRAPIVEDLRPLRATGQ